MIKKLLIANRGEIACRIIRTARKMGIETVAIYSDIDKYSKHVQMANIGIHVGENPSSKSYLRADKIIEIAKNENACAIHPGFGFLSENEHFANDCEKNKLIFVGPPSSAIKSMGSKSESKKIMVAANVPVVPGYYGDNQDPQFLLEEAQRIGFPLMIKAVLGGGGKGMRISWSKEDFLENLQSSKRESLKSFSDDRVLIERYIKNSRHIEIQVFGDYFQNYVYLFERDCSIQRRHQKVVEEAPSNINQQLREKIGTSAIQAARAVKYHNAGTVEFIFDVDSKQYYFMEMNTRLQVEHPITEMITGQDLVEWQLLVASGKPLPKKQEELNINGNAIEVRIYSEDPFNQFLPASGELKYLKEPEQKNQNVRIESGIFEKNHISIYYDPMISKLIVWGKDRAQALLQLKRALSSYRIIGLPTNIKFLKSVCNIEDFQTGIYDTGFINKHQKKLLVKGNTVEKIDILGGILVKLHHLNSYALQHNIPSGFLNFRLNYNLKQTFIANLSATHLELDLQIVADVEMLQNGKYNVTISQLKDKKQTELCKYENVGLKALNKNFIQVDLAEEILKKEFYIENNSFYVFNEEGDSLKFQFENDQLPEVIDHEHLLSMKTVKSPMSGTLLKILVTPGQTVKKGQPLVIVEAMKMEHNIIATSEANIKIINAREGQFVDLGANLIEFE